MSWWVSLEDHAAPHWCSFGTPPEQYKPVYAGDEPCPTPCYPAVAVKSFEDGGTYALGGTTEASVNITYNYNRHYRAVWGGAGLAETLDGKRAAEVIPALEKAVATLGTKRDRDYWASEPGNAGAALARLLDWARQYPDAVFRVD